MAVGAARCSRVSVERRPVMGVCRCVRLFVGIVWNGGVVLVIC